MNTTPKHSVSVAAAVVNHEGKILAIRRQDNGEWAPPGGVLELDETFHEGLVREVLEETGVKVKPGPLTGVYKNMPHAIVALYFRCTPIAGTPHPTDEATEVSWLTAQEVQERMNEAYGIRVLDALTDGPPAIREHDGAALLH